MLHVCAAHGGVYTKFGQHVACMNHVLPIEYTDTLKVLQDKNPSVGLDQVEKTIWEELGVPLSDLFSEFEEKATAAASLAQVHRAVTKDGKEVAVKLQYPGLEQQVRKDLVTMRFLAALLGKLFPDYQYSWLLPDFEESLELELDFIQEAANGERMAHMFRGSSDIYIPKICWDYTSNRVLTMEFIHGTKITERDQIDAEGLSPKRVARSVAHAFGQMIYYHGFVHCDPHPGNLMVREHPDGYGEGFEGVWRRLMGLLTGKKRHQIVILDHGMYRRLDGNFRHNYCNLWKAFMTQDTALGHEMAKALGLPEHQYEALSLLFLWRLPGSSARVGQRITEAERQQLSKKYGGGMLTAESVNVFLESLPRDMLFVMRTGDLVRSLNRELGATSRQRLKILYQSALSGLALPNVELPLGEGTVEHELQLPRKLVNPKAPVNMLTASEAAEVAGIGPTRSPLWLVWQGRVRLW
ncbi:unnamed protein product [Chrysoparadoxa australica]